jgi:CDP-glycerol glycerophosphotransferase (TagB/SpsB family)
LLRLHPTYESRTQELEGHENLHVERPGSHYGNLKYYEFEEADVRHLASSLAHADVVINTASTLMVESCIFDTPVIALGFDGDTKKDYWYSVMRYYDREHLLPVTKTGGVPIAKSFDELLSLLTKYFADPTLHRTERVAAARVVCGEIDGKAAARTAQATLEALTQLP